MEVLRGLRQAAGVSVSELAAAAGISRQHLWRVENGEAGMRVQTARRLAQALARRLGVSDATVLNALITGKTDGMFLLKREIPSRYLDVREASRYLGLSQSVVREAIRAGKLRPRAIPGPRGKILLSLEELDRFAREHLEGNYGSNPVETV